MSECREELLECGHWDCPIHHRCESRPRAGCVLEPIRRTYDADELGIDQEDDD